MSLRERRRGWRGGLTSAYVLAILLASFFHTHRSIEAGIAHCTERATHWDVTSDVRLPQAHECQACVWSRVHTSEAARAECVPQAETQAEAIQLVSREAPLLGVLSAPQSRAPPSV